MSAKSSRSPSLGEVSDRIQIIVVHHTEVRQLFSRRLSLVQQQLNFGLEERLLFHIREATGILDRLFRVKTLTVRADRRNSELCVWDAFDQVAQSIGAVTVLPARRLSATRRVTIARQRHSHARPLVESEEEHVDGRPFDERRILGLSHAEAASSRLGGFNGLLGGVHVVLAFCSFRSINLLLSALGHDLFTAKFVSHLTFLDSQIAYCTLNSLDIINMEIDTLLQYI